MNFVIILYYCFTAGCYTVVFPQEYWSKKDCMANREGAIAEYRQMESIDAKIKIGSGCTEALLSMQRDEL